MRRRHTKTAAASNWRAGLNGFVGKRALSCASARQSRSSQWRFGSLYLAPVLGILYPWPIGKTKGLHWQPLREEKRGTPRLWGNRAGAGEVPWGLIPT